jgi:pyrimidine-nucleoside phosphorylase
MSVRDWIDTKRTGGALKGDEIRAFVAGVTNGSIADAQAAALLMAVCIRGMTDEETAALTDAMLASGKRLDWSAFGFRTVDKHSTGGVGDKVSLVLAPAVAACGGRVPMISGRSLGHTGGTLDKLESIPGFRTDLSLARLQALTAEIGCAFGAATADIAPADRLLYALRDATGTVASIPLITASILSKKAAEGLSGLVLDVKVRSGAFLPARDDAHTLARSLVATSERLGMRAVALITDMSKPLGLTIGNALEVAESVAVLKGGGPRDVVAIVRALGGEMLKLAGCAPSAGHGAEAIGASLRDGSALDVFRRVVEAQGGDAGVVDGEAELPAARHREEIRAAHAGVVTHLDARALGIAATKLGAGREAATDRVAPGAGLVLKKSVGDYAERGDVLVEAHFDEPARFEGVRKLVAGAVVLGSEAPSLAEIVHERIGR